MTNGLRNELRAQKTQVLGMHVGFVDTDLTAAPTSEVVPRVIARRTLDALEAGAEEVLADDGPPGQARALGRAQHLSAGPARRCARCACSRSLRPA